jgi:hypothetical protein
MYKAMQLIFADFELLPDEVHLVVACSRETVSCAQSLFPHIEVERIYDLRPEFPFLIW